MRITIIVALVLGAVPLFAYPIALVAGVMSLAAERRPDDSALRIALMQAFVVGTFVYPLVYAPCAAVALATLRSRRRGLALGFSLAPLGYLLLLGGWMILLAALEIFFPA